MSCGQTGIYGFMEVIQLLPEIVWRCIRIILPTLLVLDIYSYEYETVIRNSSGMTVEIDVALGHEPCI